MAACFEDHGFSVVVDEVEKTWLPESLPESQFDDWEATFPLCDMEVGEPYFPELSTDEIRAAFDEYKAAAACLEGLGYDVREPPTVEVWVESWGTGNELWIPHGEVGDTINSPEKWLEIEETCPQPGEWEW